MSFEQLKAILDTDRAERAALMLRGPVACPNDGEPLEETEEGIRHCKFDGYVWPVGSIRQPNISG